MVFNSRGLNGYVGKATLARPRHRRGGQRRRRFQKKFKSKVMKVIQDTQLEKNNYHIVNNFRASALVGKQIYDQILVKNGGGDLNAVFNLINTGFAGVPGLTNKTMKFFINTYVANITMKNQANTSAIVDLYTMVPRTDLVNSIETYWVNGFADQNSSTLYQEYGTTPYMNQQVCQNFKIQGKTRYLLSPGAIELVEIRETRKVQIPWERITAVSGTPPAAAATYRGISKVWFVIVRGEPENDSTTKTLVSTSPVSVDFITNETYFYSYFVTDSTKSDLAKALGTITTASTTLVETAATGVVSTTS